MRRVVLLLVLLGGCDKLFSLEHIAGDAREQSDGDRGTKDAAKVADAEPVVCPLATLVYDEDGDSIDDRCDLCPTVPSDDLDSDMDGLPNACDLNLVPTGDALLFAATFYQPVDLSAFTSAKATWDAADKGTVVLAAAGQLRTDLLYQATKVEVRTAGMTSVAGVGLFSLGTTTVTCDVLASDCAGETSSSICLRVRGSGGGGSIAADSSTLRETTLYRSAASEAHCYLDTETVGNLDQTTSTDLGVSQIQLETNASATVVIRSIVIYGAKAL